MSKEERKLQQEQLKELKKIITYWEGKLYGRNK